jgi:integrase
MLTINHSTVQPENVVSLSDFVENVYLPWVEQFKRPSTAKGYRDLWNNRLKAIAGRERAAMRHTRTFTVQKWLNQLGKEKLGRNTLKHGKSVLSGIFTLAKQQGYFDGVNPVQGTAVNPSAREPEETHAYSLAEVQTMLGVLPEPAATIFAVAAFGGLRHGELVGLDWEDFHDGALWITRSVWNGHINEPKTRKSRAPVPVIKQLESRLEMHRLRCGNPQSGPIFATSLGSRLNLNNVLNRSILPTLNRCVTCGLSEGKAHLKTKEPHEFRRDARIPEWHGWHAARRGLGSNLYHLGISDKTIQAILRHSNVSVTMTYYVKPMSEDVLSAMANLEEKFAAQTSAQGLRDTLADTNRTAGAMPESVN